MKCSRRIRPIVSTVNIPPHHSLRIKASSATGQPWGVNFGRRSPDPGGQNCTPNDSNDCILSAMSETVDSLTAYCRENNRVCPLPKAWQQLWEMLPEKRRAVD